MPSYVHPHSNPSPPRSINGARDSSGYVNPLKRVRTPDVNDNASNSSVHGSNLDDLDGSGLQGDDRKRSLMRDLYRRSERMLASLFAEKSTSPTENPSSPSTNLSPRITPHNSQQQPPNGTVVATRTSLLNPKKRKIDEDDYGDDDDEDEDEDEDRLDLVSPLAGRKKLGIPPRLNGIITPETGRAFTPSMPLSDRKQINASLSNNDVAKSSEEVRKKLEEEKKAAEDAAIESFQTMFFTLENDSDAMVEQQKLDELDRQVETEMSGGGPGSLSGSDAALRQGTLSNTNLGASSLTLKHLISRIDAKRHIVTASDSQLRSLMSEVRKNRSKWASEDKIGQEELYEAAERVLMELKAMTEWAAPFLQKVNKRDAPDYHSIIKHPMDIGTMIKKLKQLNYKSKRDFCADLDLIWANCLRYNAEPGHFLRKKAEHMRKETARLTPLIPDIVVRDRAEVEAEERRLQREEDNDEDSDEEPIIATRGRKAPGKTSKKGAAGPARKAAPSGEENNPKADPLSLFKSEHARVDTDGEGSLATPPPGSATPLRVNGVGASDGHGDTSEIEGPSAMSGLASQQNEDPIQEDEEYQTWKQITKKDRAHAAAERHRLFKGGRINPEEPALLRSKAGMRQWLRQQKLSPADKVRIIGELNSAEREGNQDDQAGATLAEGIDGFGQTTLPDYYYSLAGVPFIDEHLCWKEDSEGNIVDRQEECLRILPSIYFQSPQGALSNKIEANMLQMQETRKISAKIGIVKQMQVQAQTYQNQFQKYDPDPFAEADTGPVVVSSDGPVMAPYVCRAALQRSVGKIFYHSGFEDFQPAAIEAITDIASEYFQNITKTFCIYKNAPKVHATSAEAAITEKPGIKEKGLNKEGPKLVPRFTMEETVLHTLHESGLDLDTIETYVTDEVGRLSSKLAVHHSRMRDYLAELLRPALDPSTAGVDGVGAFNDGSEQFIGGDFAEDIDEDFFGFRELGLDKEFGISGASVPLHLLQSRVHNAYQPTNLSAANPNGQVMAQPEPYPPMTLENLAEQIGLVKAFFRNKLDSSESEALIEDDDLPAKQRFPKPRLPPTGKISSPRKRPIREQQMMARKKRRLEIEAGREREAAEKAEAEAAAAAAASASAAKNATSSTSATATDADAATITDGTATETQVNNVSEVDTLTVDSILDMSAMVNGDSGADETAAANVDTLEKLANNNDSTLKKSLDEPQGKFKLDVPSSRVNKTGDPEKDGASNGSKSREGANGSKTKDGTENGDEKNGEENGKKKNDEEEKEKAMLSPESRPIAAH